MYEGMFESMRMRKILFPLVVVFVLGNLTGVALHQHLEGQPQEPSPGSAVPRTEAPARPAPAEAGTIELSAQEKRDIAVFEEVSASVVNVSSSELRRDFFSLNVMEIPVGTGSGFVWDDRGHVVTNFHVIDQGTRYSVFFADQSAWDAKLVGYAADKDLAVLRVEAPREHLRPIRVGSSSGLRVGQRVLAIGNPFGLDRTLTTGVVSALGRELRAPNQRVIRDVIQTDAAINPGNSGGPVLDSAGRLIGISTAIYSPSGASAGIGFAVPVDTVRRLVPQLIEFGRPVRPGIGVSLVPAHTSTRLGYEGLIIQSVAPGSPADRAGLEPVRLSRRGRALVVDRILAIDGEPVATVDDLLYAFERAGVGAEVRLTLARGDEEREVALVLEALE